MQDLFQKKRKTNSGRKTNGCASTLLLSALRAYKKAVSPLLPPRCRFYPTCAEYAELSVSRYGAAKGLILATKRLCRCNPLFPGGYDPVP